MELPDKEQREAAIRQHSAIDPANLVSTYLDLLANAGTQCPDATDQKRVAVSLKNLVVNRIIPS